MGMQLVRTGQYQKILNTTKIPLCLLKVLCTNVLKFCQHRVFAKRIYIIHLLIRINLYLSFVVLLKNILQSLIYNLQKSKAYLTLYQITYRKTPESLNVLSIDGRLQSLIGHFHLRHSVGF